MLASTLNPKADPVADHLADMRDDAIQLVYRLRRAVKLQGQREILDACEAATICVYKIEKILCVEADLIVATIGVIKTSAGFGIYKMERPLLLEVVAAVERQVELITERVT